ncbi:hypothetical protein [Acidovorax sp. NCPPB 3576]|uniref:hypothetical protein n=1 Tax=Acidovorax sp. NCPPB 3576 TaxID=2940488 RepID=UPI00234A3AE0|nr:hypothetical protein [Acidovorax sp. NCPPB 3576]WCM87963.1 hypothetical protein M5C98_21905 [Acidovorax sp. NCPPB 3576]
MSPSQRQCSDKAKPREIKRQRQREAMFKPAGRGGVPFYPDPEPPVWKPLG